MDCVETAAFKDQSVEEMKRLLHVVVVGGGPTGVEFAAELQDFFQSDLRKWIPEIREHFRVTLIEALPSVLPMFSKTLVKYTEQTFKEGSIDIRTKTTVRDVGATHIRAESYDLDNSKITEEIPYGLLVWATGNSVRPIVQSLMNQIPEQAHSRRGLTVDEHLAVRGANNVWALGDCAVANCAPTAQVAAQQGTFLAALLDQRFEVEEMEEKLKALGAEHCATSGPERYSIGAEMRDLHKKLRRKKQIAPFEYTHQGSLAYIGSEKAVADITWFTGDSVALGGLLTYFFWRSAYLNMCFSTRNRLLVAGDWIKSYVFGRDVCRE
ncbi:FAD/NAD(P)-binding domain-containing protein [Hortaea werneckii]|nr:FAD/NAD(P)-binding domain-containing protein [Hortaea werneckii]KAI7722663.1 FAD/NAD(P)-binding domain-containing protein [Hortaea werneckii]